jgi:hypothetical protein
MAMHWFINAERHGGTHKRQGFAVEIRNQRRFRNRALELNEGMALCVSGSTKADAMDVVGLFLQLKGVVLEAHECIVLRELRGAAPGTPLHWPVEQVYPG